MEQAERWIPLALWIKITHLGISRASDIYEFLHNPFFNKSLQHSNWNLIIKPDNYCRKNILRNLNTQPGMQPVFIFFSLIQIYARFDWSSVRNRWLSIASVSPLSALQHSVSKASWPLIWRQAAIVSLTVTDSPCLSCRIHALRLPLC